jgi:hypothetical protein
MRKVLAAEQTPRRKWQTARRKSQPARLQILGFNRLSPSNQPGPIVALWCSEGSRVMSQKTVQSLIGQIVTDEELRARFVLQPLETREQGFDLTTSEIEALVDTDRQLWKSAAARIHPRLQRCRLCP